MLSVSVLGIEPIEPAIGGSRLRLKGLYSNLGDSFQVDYVGAFHWPGPESRQVLHTDRLVETTIPFSDQHFSEIARLSESLGGKSVIDESFPRFGKLSREFCLRVGESVARADVVIFSHPWVYAVAEEWIDNGRQTVIYDAHNMEAALRRQLLGESPLERSLLRDVERLERRLCHRAELILACSGEDRRQFLDTYQLDPRNVRVVPNGVFSQTITPHPVHDSVDVGGAEVRRSNPVALFIGGRYRPNLEAVEFICNELARHCNEVDFVILGNCGTAYIEQRPSACIPTNVEFTGQVSDGAKLQWLRRATIALNPMFSGSGTNIKMFDYMAAGLPIVSTRVGARGIENEDALVVSDEKTFARNVRRLRSDPLLRNRLGRKARGLATTVYDWSGISERLGVLLDDTCKKKYRTQAKSTTHRPRFSITIPTLDRHEKLRRLLDLLTRQREKDFEVIVVDQSDQPYERPNPGLDIKVLHSSIKGSCRARNLAARVARGRILVMTDDDCEPGENWLREATAVLDNTEYVGLEGRIVSERIDDPGWRSVHNYGSESIGYLTCNLFVRADAFERVGGFDERFDEYDFRYDTDFGWRLEALGEIPFSDHAFVYHPPWSRAVERESLPVRDRMFEGDALLLRKHPDRYESLFRLENHWRNPEFWPHFIRGLQKLEMEMPAYAAEAYRFQQRGRLDYTIR
ncbi:MAG: glycosyltransferase [Proteobacteria bacterium]|nr:MAG: glycosyltransferase [Pseudomonadota bacterium]